MARSPLQLVASNPCYQLNGMGYPQGLRRLVASAIPELEEPAQAKAALTRLWQARQFHEGAALATGASLEAEAAAREALLAEASDARKEEAWIILTDALVRQERADLQAKRGHQAVQAKDYAEVIDAYQSACTLAPEREALHLGLLQVQLPPS